MYHSNILRELPLRGSSHHSSPATLPWIREHTNMDTGHWLVVWHSGKNVGLGELSLSHARSSADGWPLMWVNHLLEVSQLGHLSPSSSQSLQMSSELQLDLCHLNRWRRYLVNAYEVKAGMVFLAGETVWSMPERLSGLYTMQGVIQVLCFTFYLYWTKIAKYSWSIISIHDQLSWLSCFTRFRNDYFWCCLISILSNISRGHVRQLACFIGYSFVTLHAIQRRDVLKFGTYVAGVPIFMLMISICACHRSDFAWCACTVNRCFITTLCLKKVPTLTLFVTLSNLNRFSTFWHCWKAYEICYNTHTTGLRWGG